MKPDILSQYNIRKTRPREEIARVISSFSYSHFSVENILEELKNKKIKVSRASAYRTINLFCQKGLLCPVDFGEGFQVYELSADKCHHDHLYCVECGKIIEFEMLSIEKLQEDVCRKNNFQPLNHMLRIKGLCRECKDDKRGRIS